MPITFGYVKVKGRNGWLAECGLMALSTQHRLPHDAHTCSSSVYHHHTAYYYY